MTDITRLYNEVAAQHNALLRVIRETGLIIAAYWDYEDSGEYRWKWQWRNSDEVHMGYLSRADALAAALHTMRPDLDTL